MTMRSTDLLPVLRELPISESRERMSFQDMMTGLVGTDRVTFAAEFTSAVSFSLWGVFHRVNVDDTARETISQAYERAFSPEGRTVWDHFEDALDNPDTFDNTFMSPLKGAVAEFHLKEQLNQRGWNVDLAPGPDQSGWDLHGTDPAGNYTRIQVKTGESYTASDIQEHMDKYPVGDVNYADHYAMSTEIYERYIESATEAGNRTLSDIGPDYARVEGIEDGLNTLSANEGIDIPDGTVEIIPYAAAIVGGARLIYGALKNEREFKAADRTTKNRIHVVQTLTLMSRMGISTVLATAGGMGGASAGSLVPGVGNAVAGIGGTVIGAGMGMYLNKRLHPRMLDLALNITGLTHDDLFYYKNKPRIDEVAFIFQTRARELGATPELGRPSLRGP